MMYYESGRSSPIDLDVDLDMGQKVRVLNTDGNVWETSWDPLGSVGGLKRDALQHFYPNRETLDLVQSYRLVYPADSRTLVDGHAFGDEKVSENDTIMLIRKRGAVLHHHEMTDGNTRIPTTDDIVEATKNLPAPRQVPVEAPPATEAKEEDPFESAIDFQNELRKIIVSLISYMSTLLKDNPDAETISREMHGRVLHRLKVAAARPIEGITIKYPPPPEIEQTPLGIVRGFGEVRRREFRPNPHALQGLKDMGFKEEEVIKALRLNRNSKDDACEWLLNEKNRAHPPEDDAECLEPNSHLLKTLLANPMIRLGLNKTKVLYAFLSIVENTSSANGWLTDPDISPVLSSIFKVYHAEKHHAPDVE